MYLPPLLLPAHPDTRIIGDVVIHPQAVLAAGVLLWAEAGSQIRIGPGACIGMGCILHGREGPLEIGEGASLGAGVLIMGAITVGHQACIGAGTTILAGAIAPGTVIPPGSLLGDSSRQVTVQPESPAVTATPSPPKIRGSHFYHHQTETISAATVNITGTAEVTEINDPWLSPESSDCKNGTIADTDVPSPDIPPTPNAPVIQTSNNSSLARPTEPKTIYGQAYVNGMMTKMFRYRGQNLDSN